MSLLAVLIEPLSGDVTLLIVIVSLVLVSISIRVAEDVVILPVAVALFSDTLMLGAVTAIDQPDVVLLTVSVPAMDVPGDAKLRRLMVCVPQADCRTCGCPVVNVPG